MRFNAFMAYPIPLPPQRKFGPIPCARMYGGCSPWRYLSGLSTFIVFYSPGRRLQGDHYWVAAGGADYLSPFYSPEFWGKSPYAWFGPRPGWWPGVADLFTGVAGAVGAGGIPADVLLLPGRVL